METLNLDYQSVARDIASTIYDEITDGSTRSSYFLTGIDNVFLYLWYHGEVGNRNWGFDPQWDDIYVRDFEIIEAALVDADHDEIEGTELLCQKICNEICNRI